MFWMIPLAIAVIGTCSSTVFLLLALRAVRKFQAQGSAERARRNAAVFPPISVLKPLHGLEPRLKENLESFYQQDYPAYEILFAVDSNDDAALPVARDLAAKYPNIPTRVMITGEPPWPNPPNWCFQQMSEAAQHSILVTSDSDVFVGRAYLKEVVSPLLNPEVGMVTCLYRGYNAGGFWSGMDAIGMSVEMAAGVLTANLMEGMKFGLGPTIAVRKDSLAAIGGYTALKDYFANDFMIGSLMDKAGYRVVLSGHVIDHVVAPMSFMQMWRRQVRWATSTRFSRPKGHFGSGMIYSIPYGALGLVAGALSGHIWLGVLLFAWSIANRLTEALVIGWSTLRDPVCLRSPWKYLLRDALGFAIWAASYFTRNASWRSGNYTVVQGGKVVRTAILK